MTLAPWLLLTLAAVDPTSAASEAFQAQDWARAAALYSEVVRTSPRQAPAWARLGRALLEAGRPAEAVSALERAEELGFAPPLMRYERGLAEARLGRTERALGLLEPLAKGGFGPPPGFPRLPAEGSDARLTALAARFAAAAEPCTQPGAPWRQLDFWVGVWDVYDRGGNRVGDSRIERILGDCVVLENWKGSSEGKSFNTWNPARRRWEQSWVDSGGAPIFFTGALEDGVMVYHSDQPGPDGAPHQRTLTFTPLPGPRVRQFSRGSSDGGKTWSTEYDLVYVAHGQPFVPVP